jgi:hypothetical protein
MGLSAAQCGGLVVEMRVQFAVVPGGKPIMVLSEALSPGSFRFDGQDEDGFLEKTGLGGVVVTSERVVIGAPWETDPPKTILPWAATQNATPKRPFEERPPCWCGKNRNEVSSDA